MIGEVVHNESLRVAAVSTAFQLVSHRQGRARSSDGDERARRSVRTTRPAAQSRSRGIVARRDVAVARRHRRRRRAHGGRALLSTGQRSRLRRDLRALCIRRPGRSRHRRGRTRTHGCARDGRWTRRTPDPAGQHPGDVECGQVRPDHRGTFDASTTDRDGQPDRRHRILTSRGRESCGRRGREHDVPGGPGAGRRHHGRDS